MIKLAHLSDVHLGFGRSSWRFLRDDVFRSFRTAFREAAQWADIVLITGDLFHSVRNDIEAIQTAAWELREADHVVVIGGNHDTPATTGVDSPLALLADMCPGMKLVESRYRVVSVGGIDIHCVPARYLAYWVDPIVPKKDSVLAVHGIHPHSPLRPPGDTWIIPQLYDPQQFLYVALGDLHDWHSVPTLYPPREYYAGSTTYCSSSIWSESKPKGWLQVELGERLDVRFVKVPQRAWITVEADVDDGADIEWILSELERRYQRLLDTGDFLPEPPVLRVVLAGKDRVSLLNTELELSRTKMPVSALQVVRRVKPRDRTGHTFTGDIAKRWVDYVNAHKEELPSGISADELVRRGLEALALDPVDGMKQALLHLVNLEDETDEDDPFFPR